MTVKEILIKYQDYLKKDDFDGFYKALHFDTGVLPSGVGKVTEFILNADIDPLFYIDNIPDYYLYGSTITSIHIPDRIKSIGGFAFYECAGLTSIAIPNSVTSIGYDAFHNCTSLTSVTIGNSVTSIGFDAFRDCSSLTSITIPASVTSIGGGAFWGCSGLREV